MHRRDADETWNILAAAIDQIYNRNASQLSFEELYRYSYNLVLHKHGDLLYDGVTDKITSHLLTTVNNLSETQEDSLLEAVAISWKEHQITMTMIRDILMYMDRIYVQQSKRRSVYELGLHLYRVTVWEHPSVKMRVVDLLMSAVARERAGMVVDDRGLFRAIVGMLLEIGNAAAYSTTAVYHNDFEAVFLATTQEFYHTESLQYLSSATALDFCQKATARLAEEKERSHALQLPATTEGPLMSLVQTEWIERHAVMLVEMESTGFAALLKESTKNADMLQMYDLFLRVPQSVDHLREALAQRIKADGKKLMLDLESGQSDPSTFVRGVLQMRAKFHSIVEESFRNEKKAQKRMRESFEDFLNTDARAASCLAAYVDELLRVGLKNMTTEAQINEELDKAITMFRYLSDKDVFENFYRQHLAKRLLGGRSISDDAERSIMSMLKAECGYQFTTKLEGMFNDMRISKETRDKYKKYIREDPLQDNVDIEVDVLTTGYWPSQNVPACTLPVPIQSAVDHFSKFYLNDHTGRKLSWQTSAGAAELKAAFSNGRRHDLLVSTYQMCILLLFNDETTLTLGDIRTRTQIPDQELRRHLISLCTPKNRILKKGTKGRGITSDTDSFTFNPDYTSKLKRVRIPLVKETSLNGPAGGDNSAGDSANTSKRQASQMIPVAVEEDRRHLVEASIVRIMKARRRLGHNELIAEVTKQLSVRFNSAPQFIKKRIESLIEREYLERAENEHRVYMYVA